MWNSLEKIKHGSNSTYYDINLFTLSKLPDLMFKVNCSIIKKKIYIYIKLTVHTFKQFIHSTDMNINGPDSQWAKLIEEGERKHKLAG